MITQTKYNVLFLQIVAQIDKLTTNIDLDSEEDMEDGKATMLCSSNRSNNTGGSCFIVDNFSSLCSLLNKSYLKTSQTQAPELYRRSCGDLTSLTQPVSAFYNPKSSWLLSSGERIHSFDNLTYHALCCDDDEFNEEGGRRSSRFSSGDSVFSSSPVQPISAETLMAKSCKYLPTPGLSCSTKTVSHKGTQTVLPYSPARKRAASEHKH